jgi:small subunit ribosomal protein YMR-31
VQSSFAGHSQVAHGVIGAHSGRELGSVRPAKGSVMDRSELPKRFGRLKFSAEEMDAVESGGATLY